MHLLNSQADAAQWDSITGGEHPHSRVRMTLQKILQMLDHLMPLPLRHARNKNDISKIGQLYDLTGTDADEVDL